jgi:hypothetical protein
MADEIIEFDVVPERVGLAEITKYFDDKIEGLRQMVLTRPRSPNSNFDHFQWQRRFMAHYGKVLGALEFAANFGHMPREWQAAIEARVKNMIQHHMGTLIVG